MRWRGGRQSRNVEDRRGMSGGLVGGGVGAVVIALIAMFMGVDPGVVLQGGGGAGAPPPGGSAPPADDEHAQFVSTILASTEDTWRDQFQRLGRSYVEPSLVLFTGSVQSACGFARAAMGPFYCPPDQRVYIDLSFFSDLERMMGAPVAGSGGLDATDFARAYVIAHEVGHHVQTLLGVSEQVRAAQSGLPRPEANALSVRQELQADCFAGLWGYHNRQSLAVSETDIQEALAAASAIGDDRLQQKSQGHVVPESFTHGTSRQRTEWFQRGFQSGDPNTCDTFARGG